uniref:Uncharacterized protein n=1 Tax=Glossina austeni TaxID=7395 RepID=A0A1A9VQV6_GLOAU
MADDTLQTLPLDTNIDAHIITLFERLETIRRDQQTNAFNSRLSSTLQPKKSMQAEIRTLEFWRCSHKPSRYISILRDTDYITYAGNNVYYRTMRWRYCWGSTSLWVIFMNQIKLACEGTERRLPDDDNDDGDQTQSAT